MPILARYVNVPFNKLDSGKWWQCKENPPAQPAPKEKVFLPLNRHRWTDPKQAKTLGPFPSLNTGYRTTEAFS